MSGTPDQLPSAALEVLGRVGEVIEARKAGQGMTNAEGKSYVRRLLDAGAPKISDKIREEAGELCDALAEETDERVVSEAADLVFHVMVGLSHRGLSMAQVAHVLRERMGISGIDEKASR